MSATNIASTKDVLTAISGIGIEPPDQNAMAAIQRNCRDSFVEHLSACVTGQDADGRHRKAIEGLLTCLTVETGEAIRSLGLIPMFNTLAQIGIKSPAKFLSAIPIAKDKSHDRHAEALSYLTQVLTPLPETTDTPAPATSSTPTPSPAPVARVLTPVSVPAPTAAQYPVSIQPTSVTQSKDYISQHVYGSGFALCFNAGEWDGKPGVMVDAAVSNGPKSYDWKGAVHVWLDVREVAAVLAVFRKRRPSVEFSAHGAQNDKSFAISFQGSHFFTKISARNKGTRAVKILPTDATAVSVLFLRQLGRAYPDIPLDTVLELAMTVNESSAASLASVA